MKKYVFLLCTIVSLLSCKNQKQTNGKLNIVTTTTMITDLVKNIGGEHINLQGLMGSGVDPHLYKASEGDVTKLANADIIFYNGLHLEGKLVEVFEKMKNKKTIAIADALDKSTLIGSEYFASNYDPHIWFNVDYWKQATAFVVKTLSEQIPEQKTAFEANGAAYTAKLNALKTKIENTIATLPKEQRILVTAHDAFNYFGKAFNFKVVGLQGLSTATEAGVKDVQKLSTFIIENKVKSIFVESSVPKRTIQALQAAVKSKGHDVAIGGTLYSDALGDAETIEGTYIGMFEYNVNTIVEALK
ncbi:metal ABC transporter solute-binding protein, Zn/Mn family [Jejuia pallidilutea]|uniref:Manganese ABC transporter periplasmic-binding protein SitA n=1 Tax=Jejuia pallidilutea TaxID=504487 RepID=A0A090VZH7_9FLAO|nr:zinc ABC transporter substrate-binding protein [Jejuia pallidilutea]GAL65605.1 manganese ABC transporter periplasmic-binding protein SitA [Jejuia pallidilutea]GAL70170.1 manganese ABC transporter periplasmic-binding protein SitA [Jejuia pallidilutea]GAL88863.1 manganese ABC transporter periplasmic-binding protein SitA [Jejuia pallidilutea]